jgi:sialidase-1
MTGSIMKHFKYVAVLIGIGASLGIGAQQARPVVLWQKDVQYPEIRIPSLIVTQKGTVLAFAEGREGRSDAGDIDLVMKRSSDNGRTWSDQMIVWDDAGNTCGNPCPVVDESSGRIILFMIWNPGSAGEGNPTADEKEAAIRDARRPYLCYSDDDGRTWSKPRDMTESCKRSEWGWYATGPGIAIQMKLGKYRGRLIIPANHSYPTEEPKHVVNQEEKWGYGAHVLISDDSGESWRISESITPGCNESQVVELSDGRLMMNMRSYNGLPCRAVAYSKDGGETWSEAFHSYQLPDEQVQASIIEYGKYGENRMHLFSNPGNPWDRVYMAIKVSFDDCKTWSNEKLIYAAKSAYSCMTVLPNGHIGLLFEGGKAFRHETVTFVSIPPDELFTPGTYLALDDLP